MKKTIAVVIGVGLFVLLMLFTSTYTVRYHELAIKTRFGKMQDDSVQAEAGLHFKLPLFEQVATYDTRLQLLESPLRMVATADDQQVMVRAFLMWKVEKENARAFHEHFTKMSDANDGLKERLNTALEQMVKGYAFEALVGAQSRLPEVEGDLLEYLSPSLNTLGVKPVSVGISQVVLPAKTTSAVLKRMQVSRNSLAEAERQKGGAEAAGIDSEARTVVDKFLAFANQRVEEIRAAADENAAAYLAEMREDVELAVFLLWLDTLETSLQQNTTLFFTDKFAPWHMLNSTNLGDAGPIPQPETNYIQEPIASDQFDEEGPATAEAPADQTIHAAKGQDTP